MTNETPEVWFEKIGVEPFVSYMPSTMKGFWVLLEHILAMCLVLLPIALLAQFDMLSDAWTLGLAALVAILGFWSLIRIMHRHSAP